MTKTVISLVLAFVMVFSLVLVAAPAAEAAGHTDHCVCGGKAAGLGDHTACTTVTGWKDLNAYVASTGKVLEAGNYYLSANLDLKDAGVLNVSKADIVVTICLNGYTLTNSKGDAAARAIYVKDAAAGATLNICDCKGTGVLTSTSTAQGAVIRTDKTSFTGSVNLYSGTLVGSQVETAGGTVRICKGTLNIYNAVLKDGKHVLSNNSWAGNLMISDKATANMYGGAILNGSVKAGGSGANVYISAGCHFNLYGGAISGGAGAADIGGASGANILIKSPTTSFTMAVNGNLVIHADQLDPTITIDGPDYMGAYTVTKQDTIPEPPTEPSTEPPTEEPTEAPTQAPTQGTEQPTTGNEPTTPAGDNGEAGEAAPDNTLLIVIVAAVAVVGGVVAFLVFRKKEKQ